MLLDSVQRCLRVLPPSLRRGWWALVPLHFLAALADLGAATAIFVAFAQLTGSNGGRAGAILLGTAGRLGVAPAYLALGGAAAAVVSRNVLAALAAVLRARVMGNSIDAAFRRAVSRILAAPFSWHSRASSGALLVHLTSTIDSCYRIVMAAAVAITADALVILAVAAALAIYAPLPALAACILLAALLYISGLATRGPMLRWGRASHEAQQRVIGELTTLFDAIAEVKSFRREREFLDRSTARHAQYIQPFRRHVAALSLPRLATETVFGLAALGAVAALAGDQEALPKIAVFAYAGFRLVPSLNRMVFHLDEMRHGRGAVEHLSAGPVESLPDAGPPEGTPLTAAPLAESIRIEALAYRHDGAAADTLHDIRLHVRRGEAIGLVGETGAGKTTLLHLLAGLLDPTAGAIEADGRPLREWLRDGACRIALVPQRIALLDDTIRNNVAFAIPPEAIDDERLRAAVRDARLDGLLARLPAGLETHIGERGARLSGGERQRIAIARALYAGADVLLLDEPVSALDEETAGQIAAALESLHGQRTLVIASHRTEILSFCDRVLELRDGTLSAARALR